MSDWLRTYYGPAFENLKPEVVIDGQKHAVVKITNPDRARRYSSIGYVLVRKTSSHSMNNQKPLHEGIASHYDMERMKMQLQAADRR